MIHWIDVKVFMRSTPSSFNEARGMVVGLLMVLARAARTQATSVASSGFNDVKRSTATAF
jgi:hypothetical protein